MSKKLFPGGPKQRDCAESVDYDFRKNPDRVDSHIETILQLHGIDERTLLRWLVPITFETITNVPAFGAFDAPRIREKREALASYRAVFAWIHRVNVSLPETEKGKEKG